MFTRLSLKTKLISLCVFLAFLTAVVGGVAYVTLTHVIANYDHVVNMNYANSMSLAGMRGAQKDAVIAVVKLQGQHATAADLKDAQTRLDSAITKMDENAKVYEAITFVPGEKELWDPTSKSFTEFKDLSKKLLTLSAGSKEDEAERDRMVDDEYMKSRNELLLHLNKLIDFQKKESDAWVAQAGAEGSRGIAVIVGLAMGSFLFAVLFGVFFSSSLSKVLSSLAEQLASGGREVTAASGQISEAGSELAASATQQAAALQQAVASIDEISAMINKNAENAKQSQQTASLSHQTATKGKQAVEQMVASIGDIRASNTDIMQQITSSNQEISGIVKIISEIGNKTKVINDIVFQTKLLSFNASVEAARAGEHGKGFAVVAEEVGNLAQMSGNAAKEISQMLEDSIRKVEMTVNSTKAKVDDLMSTGTHKIESGIATAERCGKTLDEIVTNVNSLSVMVNEIATASHEQAQGVQEITKAMGQLDQVTQQNAAASQQAASAGEELNGQAVALHASVAQLVKTVQGSSQEATDVVVHEVKVDHGHRKSSDQPSQLLQFKKKDDKKVASAKAASRPVAVKQAVGSDVLPSEDDPRFKDL